MNDRIEWSEEVPQPAIAVTCTLCVKREQNTEGGRLGKYSAATPADLLAAGYTPSQSGGAAEPVGWTNRKELSHAADPASHGNIHSARSDANPIPIFLAPQPSRVAPDFAAQQLDDLRQLSDRLRAERDAAQERVADAEYRATSAETAIGLLRDFAEGKEVHSIAHAGDSHGAVVAIDMLRKRAIAAEARLAACERVVEAAKQFLDAAERNDSEGMSKAHGAMEQADRALLSAPATYGNAPDNAAKGCETCKHRGNDIVDGSPCTDCATAGEDFSHWQPLPAPAAKPAAEMVYVWQPVIDAVKDVEENGLCGDGCDAIVRAAMKAVRVYDGKDAPAPRSRVGWTEADALDGDSTGARVQFHSRLGAEMVRVRITEEPGGGE